MYTSRHGDPNERVIELVAHADHLKRQSSRPPPPPMSPPRSAAYIQQADALVLEGRLAEASESLTRAAEGPRFAVHALRQRAQIEERLGQTSAAIRTLKDALHCSTGDASRMASIFTEIGDLYARRRDPNEAAYHLKRALRLDPDNDGIRTRLEWCSARSKSNEITTARTDVSALP